jgi:hypothetical protein
MQKNFPGKNPLKAYITGITVLLCTLSPILIYAAGPAIYELAPGVVVDRDRSAVYAMHQDRSVEAIDLSNGGRLWLSEAAEKPLWVAGDTIYSQGFPETYRGNLSVVFLNAADGNASGELEIALPEGVSAPIDQQRGKAFNISFRGDNQDLSASWDFLDQSATRFPWPDQQQPRVISERGAARLDPFSRVATPVSPDAVSARALAPPAVARLLSDGDMREPFWLADTVAATVSNQPRSGGGRQIVLQRWDIASGDRRADSVLFEGQTVTQMASSDQQHLLVSSATLETVSGMHQYRWSLFSLETGEAVAELSMNSSFMPFSVVGGTLLQVTQPFGHRVEGNWVEVPPQIRLVDLQSGAVLWARPIRDTLDRGPVPSARQEQ